MFLTFRETSECTKCINKRTIFRNESGLLNYIEFANTFTLKPLQCIMKDVWSSCLQNQQERLSLAFVKKDGPFLIYLLHQLTVFGDCAMYKITGIFRRSEHTTWHNFDNKSLADDVDCQG